MRQFQLPLDLGGATVRIASGGLASIGDLLRKSGHSARAFLITDETVQRLYGPMVADACRASGIELLSAVVAPGEASKSLATASEVYDQLADANWKRDEPIVALGGGVITDLAGFVAATWARGVPLVSCPTSLLATIDAAIGGKCGLNHSSGKNRIGVFYHPAAVLIDPFCLRSLPGRELRAGLAESVKHALIADESFLDWQEQRADEILALDESTLEELLDRNIRIKCALVQGDVLDQLDSRIMLNFGHTVGHAIECCLDFELPHGECVALGMVAAMRISRGLGLVSGGDMERLERILRRFELPTSAPGPLDVDRVMELIKQDKKVQAGRRRFVLLDEIGRAVLRDDVPDALVRDSVNRLGSKLAFGG